MNTQTYQPINRQALMMMVFCCLVWGAQQVVIKAAANDMAPILQVAIRSFIACLILFLLMVVKKEARLLPSKAWKSGLVAGFLFGLEFLLVGEGLKHTTASHMVVFLYTAPIFAAIGLQLFIPAEKLNVVQWGGIALAFIGIAVIFLKTGDASASDAGMMWGDVLGLLGGLTWAITTIVIRTTLIAYSPAKVTLFYQLLGAFVVLFPASLLSGSMQVHWTSTLWLSLLYQTFIICLVSFILWFWMLKRYLASMLGVLSFMTPLFGVIMGVLFLDEPLTLRFVIGSLFAMVGLVIVTGFNGIRIYYQKRRLKNAASVSMK